MTKEAKKQVAVKLYGGVAHGKVHHLTPDGLTYGRIEVLERDIMSLRASARMMDVRLDDLSSVPSLRGYPIERASYYIHEYRQFGYTEARAEVVKRLWVGIWENGEVFPDDEYEMSYDIAEQPWEWRKKPSLLYGDLDQWMEYTMDEIGFKPVRVLCCSASR